MSKDDRSQRDIEGETPGDSAQRDAAAREDTDAILSRRAFLIQSALAGAGIAATGCDNKKPSSTNQPGPRPQPCLKIAPRPDAGAPQKCLSVPARPQPCLKVAPPPPKPDAGTTKPAPHPCLSKPAPRRCLSLQRIPRRPHKCLSIKPKPRPCLDFE